MSSSDEHDFRRPDATPVDVTAPADQGRPAPAIEDPWLAPPPDAVDVTPQREVAGTAGTDAPDAPGRGRSTTAAVGLFAAGAVAGSLLTGIYTGWGSNASAAAFPTTTSSAQPAPSAPGARDLSGPGFARQDGSGSSDWSETGEERVFGQLAKVSGPHVTIVTDGTTQTFAISPDTELVRDGAPAAPEDFKAGDLVRARVLPSSMDDGVLKRLVAQSSSPAGTSGGTSSSNDGSSTASQQGV